MRRLLFACLLLVVAVAVVSAFRRDSGRNVPSIPASQSTWSDIASGLEMRTLRDQQHRLGDVKIVALRTSPDKIEVVTGDTLTAPLWRRREKAVAAVNGGFFDTAGHSLGLRISGGRLRSRLKSSDWGVFSIAGGKARIRHTRDFPRDRKLQHRISQAVQCGPRLVVDGAPTTVKPQTARRIGIGIQRDGKVVIALSDQALALQDWANLWASKSGLNCRDALNLDGGGSTQLSLKTSKRSLDIAGQWPVPDALVIH